MDPVDKEESDNNKDSGEEEEENPLKSAQKDTESGKDSEDFAKNGSKEDIKLNAVLMSNYENLLREIEAQNNVVNELKEKICEKCQIEHLTKYDEMELRNLRCCLEKENLKLRCLLKNAIALQGEDPSYPWTEIPIATTLQEDSMPIGMSQNMMQSIHKKAFSEDESDRSSSQGGDLDVLCCLLNEVNKNNKKSQRGKKQQLCQGDDQSAKIDCKLLEKIKHCLQNRSKTSGKYGFAEDKLGKICKELNRSYNMQERLVQDNVSLEGDRFKLQGELLGRDNMIETLQRRLQCMKCELQKLCREKQMIIKDAMESGNEVNVKTVKRLKKYKDCTTALKNNIDCMQTSIERMRIEMGALRKERNEWGNVVQKDELCGSKKTRANEIDELKKNYANLLADYCKKENQLKELQNQMKSFVGHSEKKTGLIDDSVDKMELKLLREKLNDLHEEQEEFKCLIKEQSQHLDDYRNKYMIAQQKVEEQKCIIVKMEITNKEAENQINMEIHRIKNKFQEKLDELSHLPNLLDNEKIKLATVCKEKEELEQKLRLVCKEFKAIKSQIGGPSGNDSDATEKLRKAEYELSALQKLYEVLKTDKELICEKLEKCLDDLDTLRTESARIIALTKERSESQRVILQDRIDKLEKELAQCRAAACVSISDREEVIKEMKGQLCTLSYSFDSAQKQIKTLKNHITYLATDNCYPIKC